MSKLLGLGAIGLLSYYGYRKATEFETNVTIKNKEVNSCLFGKIDRHIVNTDKGVYVLQNKIKKFDIGPMLKLNSFEYGPVELELDQTYHVTAYGLDYPRLHLHKTIVSENGTPCDNNHCTESKSLINKFIGLF